MKKLSFIFVFLLLIVAPLSYADVDTFDGQTGVDTWDGQTGIDTVDGQPVASGTTTCYAGYPTTGGVPDSATGTIKKSGSAGDRVYVRGWTATEGGTANAINLYVFATITADVDLVCLYNGTTLIGTADIDGASASEWTGWIPITVIDGESLTFSTSDNLRFGVAYDNGNDADHVAYDDGDSTSAIFYNLVTPWVTVPPSPISFTESSAHGFMSALRYTK